MENNLKRIYSVSIATYLYLCLYICMYLSLNHFPVYQKLTQYYKSIILQFLTSKYLQSKYF